MDGVEISNDEYEAWKAEPITELVFQALRHQADAAREAWLDASWGGGETDPVVLAALKARAEICEHLINWTSDDLEAELNRSEDED